MRFVTDFCCPSLRLIVEIDGGYHNTDEQTAEDKIRQELIGEFGYTFVRISNKEVTNHLTTVLQTIQTAAQILTNKLNAPKQPLWLPSPSEGREGWGVRV